MGAIGQHDTPVEVVPLPAPGDDPQVLANQRVGRVGHADLGWNILIRIGSLQCSTDIPAGQSRKPA